MQASSTAAPSRGAVRSGQPNWLWGGNTEGQQFVYNPKNFHVSHAETAYQTAEDLEDQNHWEPIIAHELAHHWFGDLVTTESWANLTVNESFANYSEYLWLDYKYGRDVADEHLLNNMRQYQHRPTDFSKDLVRFGYDRQDDMFDLVSYNKGGAILNMLRDYLGDEAFFAGVADYLKTNAYGTGEAHQLRLSLEKISGKDLNWFFNQWYFGSGNPVIDVVKKYNAATKKLTVKIVQTQDEKILFQFPLEIDVYENGKKKLIETYQNGIITEILGYSRNGSKEREIKLSNGSGEFTTKRKSITEQLKARFQDQIFDSGSRLIASISTGMNAKMVGPYTVMCA